MIWDEKAEALWKKVRVIAFSMLVFSPIVYAVIGYLLDIKSKAGGEFDMVLYIMLIVAVIQPSSGKIISRFQIDAYKKNQLTKMTRDQLYLSVVMIEMALVDAIYLYGLFQVILTGEINRMFYFYPIGTVWTFVYWPRRSHYENFVQRIEANVPYTG